MNIPKQLKIGSHVFDVLYPFDFKDEGNTLGRCCFTAGEIQIAEDYDVDSRKVPESRKRVVLLHEVLHAALDVCGKGEDSNNEPLIESVAETMLTIFRENPDLVSCLMEDTKQEKVTTENYTASKPTLSLPYTANHAGFVSREEAK